MPVAATRPAALVQFAGKWLAQQPDVAVANLAQHLKALKSWQHHVRRSNLVCLWKQGPLSGRLGLVSWLFGFGAHPPNGTDTLGGSAVDSGWFERISPEQHTVVLPMWVKDPSDGRAQHEDAAPIGCLVRHRGCAACAVVFVWTHVAQLYKSITPNKLHPKT